MSTESLVAQARACANVEPLLGDSTRAALAAGAASLAAAAKGGRVYGLTTGVGALREVAVDGGDDHGLRLWRSHAARFGPELDDVDARATMLARLRQLAAGPSGVSLELAEALERALVQGAVPVLHGYGSIGTADLSVLAELGLALVGAGPWRERSPEPATVTAADALPFVSSNAMTVGTGALIHDDLAGLLVAAERVAVVAFLALRGSAEAYDRRVFEGRNDPSAAAAAGRLSGLLEGGPAAADRVQDPFALRTLPQVHGVAGAALDAVEEALLAELDAPRENPVPIDGTALHHGQFLTQRLAVGLDGLRSAYAAVARLSQARLAALVDPRLTGLPAFLASGQEGSSGLMILEYVAADLVARTQAAATPTTLVRTSVSLGMEETASHSSQGVLAGRTIAALLPDLLACELLAATRALRLDPGRLDGGGAAVGLARAALDELGGVAMDDHPLGDELRTAAGVVREWAERSSALVVP